jgi:hypothetical protein
MAFPIVILAAAGIAAMMFVKNKSKTVSVSGRSGNKWLVKIHPNQTIPQFDVFTDAPVPVYVLTYSQAKEGPDAAFKRLVKSSPNSQALLMAAISDFSIFMPKNKKNTGTNTKVVGPKKKTPGKHPKRA